MGLVLYCSAGLCLHSWHNKRPAQTGWSFVSARVSGDFAELFESGDSGLLTACVECLEYGQKFFLWVNGGFFYFGQFVWFDFEFLRNFCDDALSGCVTVAFPGVDCGSGDVQFIRQAHDFDVLLLTGCG